MLQKKKKHLYTLIQIYNLKKDKYPFRKTASRRLFSDILVCETKDIRQHLTGTTVEALSASDMEEKKMV